MQNANGMFKKVGSKGEARAVVVTLVTATAHSRLFSTGWALSSVFIETDSPSPPPHGPPRHATQRRLRRSRRACTSRVREASSACAVFLLRRAARRVLGGYSRQGQGRGLRRSWRAGPGGRRVRYSSPATGPQRGSGPTLGASTGVGGRQPHGVRASTCSLRSVAAPPSSSGALRRPLLVTARSRRGSASLSGRQRLDLRKNFPALHFLYI